MTSEARRLREAREGTPWRAWGPYLSERQWGTVREDYSDDGDAWSYFSHDAARSRDLPLGRGRTRGHLRREAAAVLRARALERARPDPEGAPLRADQRRGQPRRGREGVLLLRRQPADAQLPALALQVPAGGVPVRRTSSTPTARGLVTRWSTSCSTPACSTTTGTSTSRSSTPRPVPTTSSVASPCTTGRPTRRTDPRAADAVVPQHVVMAAARPEAPDRSRRRRAAHDARGAPGARHVLSARRARRRAPVLRERERTTRACGAARAATPYPKDGDQRSRRPRRRDR